MSGALEVHAKSLQFLYYLLINNRMKSQLMSRLILQKQTVKVIVPFIQECHPPTQFSFFHSGKDKAKLYWFPTHHDINYLRSPNTVKVNNLCIHLFTVKQVLYQMHEFSHLKITLWEIFKKNCHRLNIEVKLTWEYKFKNVCLQINSVFQSVLSCWLSGSLASSRKLW